MAAKCLIFMRELPTGKWNDENMFNNMTTLWWKKEANKKKPNCCNVPFVAVKYGSLYLCN